MKHSVISTKDPTPTAVEVHMLTPRPADRAAGREARKPRPASLLLGDRPIRSPFGDLAALSVRRRELEEEVLALWEG